MGSDQPVFERLQITVKPGTDVPKLVNAIYTAAMKPDKPKGSGHSFWGQVVEKPDNVEMWLEWDSVDAHMAHVTLEKAQEVLGILMPALAGVPTMQHITFTTPVYPQPPDTLVEILTFWPPPKSVEFLSGDDEQKGYLGQVHGNVLEDLPFGDETHKPLVALVGWDDKEGKGKDMEIEGFKCFGEDGEFEPNVARFHIQFHEYE